MTSSPVPGEKVRSSSLQPLTTLRFQPKFYTILSINKYGIVKIQKRTAQVVKTPTGITKTLKKQIHTAKAQHT